jgi:hypothetical protein
VEVKKTMLIPDGNGSWQVGEVKEQAVKVDGRIALQTSVSPALTDAMWLMHES